MHFFLTFTTNGSEGMESGAIHFGVRLFASHRSIDLLVNTHEKQITKLEKQYSTSLENKHTLTSIGCNTIHSLRGQCLPDPKSFTTDTDVNGLTTLICKFLTKTNIGDSEQ